MSKRKVLITAFGVIIFFSIFLVNFIQGKYVVPIVMYHSVNPEASPKNMLAVSTATFERQMQFLKMNHYNVLPLESLATLIKERKKISPRTIAITLDDGYKDNYIYAFPILKKYNLPATIFIILSEVGRPQDDRLSWDEIKIMQDSGIITFGSHTLGSEPLINIKSEQEIKKQIFDSKKILEEKLGRPISAFSYPEGRFNNKIKQLVMYAGYTVAVATNPGKRFANDDIFALKRLRISANCNNLFIYWVETSGYYNFMRERRHKK
jgi:peptidoglycan/xylan/chitin deacetylase (PgdA/CDA1 family)